VNHSFYVLRRNDGYVFIQRYIPRDYQTLVEKVSFEKLVEFDTWQEAYDFAEKTRQETVL
jgi:hypothetical protein